MSESKLVNEVRLAEIVGGAVQERFQTSLEKVLDNMLNPNTPYKAARGITIKLTFSQNEQRNDIKAHIDVSEKLAPQGTIETSFAFGRDLNTGEIMVEEYGKQIKGQLTFNDVQTVQTEDGKEVDMSTGEVLDFRKVAAK